MAPGLETIAARPREVGVGEGHPLARDEALFDDREIAVRRSRDHFTFPESAELAHVDDAPAFPVEAVTTISAPISCARVTTMALARSLNEAVGLRDSSFSHKFCNPYFFASDARLKTGVPPAA